MDPERSEKIDINSKELRAYRDPARERGGPFLNCTALTIHNDSKVIVRGDDPSEPHTMSLVWAGRTTMLRRTGLVGIEWNGQAHSTQWYGTSSARP